MVEQARRPYYQNQRPTLFKKVNRPTTTANAMSGVEIKATQANTAMKGDIEHFSEYNKYDIININDDTNERSYSDVSSDDDTKRTNSNESNSAVSNFQLREAILDVEKIHKEFRQIKEKIQNIEKPSKKVKRAEEIIYEDVSDEDDVNGDVIQRRLNTQEQGEIMRQFLFSCLFEINRTTNSSRAYPLFSYYVFIIRCSVFAVRM